MAEGRVFVCNNCRKSIEAWSDGNPYYYDKLTEQKKYAYHPDHENLDKCIGNDTPHLCLSCSHQFKIDSLSPIEDCPKCNSDRIADTFHLSGETCPFCKKGAFYIDPEQFSVS